MALAIDGGGFREVTFVGKNENDIDFHYRWK
jgi:hypothetical protein